MTWEEIRTQRDQLLRDSDWTQIPDASCDQWSWKIYRHNLRYLPEKYANPEDVQFPAPPPAEQDMSDF